MVEITYARSVEAWQGYVPFLKELIERNHVRNICEIGGGASPALPIDWILARRLRYTILDRSKDELDKAPVAYRKIVKDICSRDLDISDRFDFVFSRMLAEHATDGQTFHKNVFHILSPGGLAFHFFPTLYAPPFLANRLLPENLASLLLDLFHPRDRFKHDKFPAYYSWCRGPTRVQIKRLSALGYEVVAYKGFFGHEGYYEKIPVIKNVSAWISEFLTRYPLPVFTSYAYVILKKRAT